MDFEDFVGKLSEGLGIEIEKLERELNNCPPETTARAFTPTFTEEQGMEHLSQILAMKPGDAICCYAGDYSEHKGLFVHLDTKNNGVVFAAYNNEEVCFARGPICSIRTTITYNMVEARKAVKEWEALKTSNLRGHK